MFVSVSKRESGEGRKEAAIVDEELGTDFFLPAFLPSSEWQVGGGREGERGNHHCSNHFMLRASESQSVVLTRNDQKKA